MTQRRIFILAATLAFYSFSAAAQPVRVLASNGMRAVIEDLQPKAEKSIGRPLSIEYGSTTMLRPKLDSGEGYDVAIVTTPAMDDLVKAGKIAPDSRLDLARCGIGVGQRAGAQKPDIKTGEGMTQALLKAKAVTYAEDGASRITVEKMFARMGIADQMKAKTILEQGSVRSAGRVVKGDADYVLTLISEILPIKGLEVIGPLPAEYQGYISFAAGVAAKSPNKEPAASLVKFLVIPENASIYKAKGMEPR
ncbi:MAG: substrate-binding domain-containing protein [Bryobacterales bacterium]|nr:substrate-binding domain-containing protein [Bryobacterales bacterium]MBV9397122.1 substrate-binding domain-containing protein [Bryobacterales bacterium]